MTLPADWDVTTCTICSGPLRGAPYPHGARVYCSVECSHQQEDTMTTVQINDLTETAPESLNGHNEDKADSPDETPKRRARSQARRVAAQTAEGDALSTAPADSIAARKAAIDEAQAKLREDAAARLRHIEAERAALLALLGEEESHAAPRPHRARSARRAAVKPAKPARARAPRSGERLPRRSAEDIARALDSVVVLVKKHKEGLRAEQIRAELGLQAKEMPRVLKQGLADKLLKARGEKRATTYTAR